MGQGGGETGTGVTSANLLQFLAWIAARRRGYAETTDAWRTSCPRLSAWEDALADDLVRVERAGAVSHGEAAVLLTEKGAALLKMAWRTPRAYGTALD